MKLPKPQNSRFMYFMAMSIIYLDQDNLEVYDTLYWAINNLEYEEADSMLATYLANL